MDPRFASCNPSGGLSSLHLQTLLSFAEMTDNEQSSTLAHIPLPVPLRRYPHPRLSPHTTSPPPLSHRERGDLCGFADPSDRGEIRAASSNHRLEGSRDG